MRKLKIVEAMKKRHVVSPFDLTEFDQWVNDATREDLNKFAKGKYFGLKFWEWEEVPLHNALNFSVDIVFRESERKKVFKIIREYQRKKKNSKWVIDKLFDLAVYTPIWVLEV